VDTLLGGALNDPEVNEKFLGNASKSTERLVRLVDDLGEISKLESGRIPLVQESFLIQELIKDVYEELSLRAKEKNIQLTFKKGTERPLAVYADKQKIKQVLVNLVENAIKYGHDNGTVTAGSYIVDDKHVYTEISDDGPGIAEEHLSRIFERFYRADRSRSRTIGGTGLGLAIVKHIIEAHGHQATVRSTLNVGSSFGFTLDRGKE
jgi:two-component system phosphate regulon sensor histidine kinase PhoR